MKNTVFIIVCITILISCISESYAQKQKISWKKSEPKKPELELFHSIQVLNLPTAETLKMGNFQFEISHRFNTPVTSGIGDLYGLDGSATMRIGLSYAFTDHMLLTVARSNREGNIDVQYKFKFLQYSTKLFPTVASGQIGFAYNGKPIKSVAAPSRNFQYFASIILNTLVNKKFCICIIPTYLYNSHIYCADIQYSFTMGFYFQYYLSETWSLIFEANPTISGWRDQFDSYAFGIEIETGGHFFKFLVGTNHRMNFPQYIAGAESSFKSGDWFLGFNITRLLKFW